MLNESTINQYVDHIIDEYIKAGGDEKNVNREIAYWTLKGIYDREGEQALDSFMKNWKPHIPQKKI